MDGVEDLKSMKNQALAGPVRLAEPFWLRDWCIHASTNELSRGDETLRLEPRTMAVLVCLAERAGEAVTRELLEEEVWRDLVVGYDSLSHSIARLRKVFGDDPGQPRFIETIPKVGYRLIAELSNSPTATAQPADKEESALNARRATEPTVALSALKWSGVIATLLILVLAMSIWYSAWKEPSPGELSIDGASEFPAGRPSIAVLPFENMSDDPSQVYFSDGITDDLITDLSKLSGLFVIARNSSFAYRDTSADVQTIARELGVRYILEGSVRKDQDRVRINAQLVDTATGGHLWADRYDGSLSDLFDLQDKVTSRIVEGLRVQLTSSEQAIVAGRYTDNLAAYDAFLQGHAHMLRKTPRDAIKAIAFLERAVELDPDYHRAFAAMAQIYWEHSSDQDFFALRQSMRGETGYISPVEYASEDEAWINLQKARGESSPQAYALAALMHLRQRRYEEALREADRAVAIGRNDPIAYDALIEVLVYSGETERATRLIDEAIKLDPNLPGEKLFLKGLAYYSMGDGSKALELIERARKHNPEKKQYAAISAAVLAERGRDREARLALDQYLSRWPTYTTLDWILFRWPFQDAGISERLADGLKKAGYPVPGSMQYLVSARDRLVGEEIRTLLADKTMIGIDRGPGGLEDEFEVTRNASLQIIRQGFLTYYRSGTTRIENDLLCDPWWQYGDFCVAVFRNRIGSRDAKSEYVFFTLVGAFTFSVFEPEAL